MIDGPHNPVPFRTLVLVQTFVLALAVICIASGCGGGGPTPLPRNIRQGDWTQLEQHLTPRLDKLIQRSKTVGLSIAIVDEDQPVYARGFGFADKKRGIAATAETTYRVGSLSKPVTAAALMTLVESGAVSLDSSVATYLPDFSIQSRFENTDPITLRSVLTHNSGIPNLMRRSLADGRPVPFNQLVTVMRDAFVTNPPWQITKYSNHGYNLIGCVIERVSSRPFAEYVEEAVMRPLAMDRASFALAPESDGQLATAYRKGKPVAELPPLDGEIPSGGLRSSVSDYARFMTLFLRGNDGADKLLFANETIDAMRTPVTDNPLDFDERTGLLWFHTLQPGLEYAGPLLVHGGSTFLFHSRVLMSTNAGVGIVVCANTAEARQTVEKVTIDAMRLALAIKTGLRPPVGSEKKNKLASPPVSKWASFAGRYQTQVGIIDVNVGERIEARLLGRRFRLVPEAGDWSSLRYLLLGSVPISIPDLRPLRFSFATVSEKRLIVVAEGERQVRLGERIEPVPVPEAWRRRAGSYNLVNTSHAGVTFSKTPHVLIRLDGDYLVVHVHPAIHPSVELSWVIEPVDDNNAVFAGTSNYLGGETLQAIQRGGGELIVFSGYEFERVDS